MFQLIIPSWHQTSFQTQPFTQIRELTCSHMYIISQQMATYISNLIYEILTFNLIFVPHLQGNQNDDVCCGPQNPLVQSVDQTNFCINNDNQCVIFFVPRDPNVLVDSFASIVYRNVRFYTVIQAIVIFF
ncbi:Hypothetical_protein [Hexamita inflata]|uniref:Hypothetical_protein n=1 Tax=Hexamita inflata TaxID=28002 RepID=A0AA86QAC2_9EUKA|nr:Hypothetical protein HINF_LOCUS42905 [Hexamita inflata]